MVFFFFQAEDGIRDTSVTGVQTCALPIYLGNADTRAFAHWTSDFERRCIRSQYLTQAQLPEVLRTAVATGHITLPPGLLLVGFDSKSPAQIALLGAVQATGVSIEELLPQSDFAPTSAPSAAHHILVDAPDEDAEIDRKSTRLNSSHRCIS